MFFQKCTYTLFRRTGIRCVVYVHSRDPPFQRGNYVSPCTFQMYKSNSCKKSIVGNNIIGIGLQVKLKNVPVKFFHKFTYTWFKRTKMGNVMSMHNWDPLCQRGNYVSPYTFQMYKKNCAKSQLWVCTPEVHMSEREFCFPYTFKMYNFFCRKIHLLVTTQLILCYKLNS